MITWKEKFVNFFIQNWKKALFVLILLVVICLLVILYSYMNGSLKMTNNNSDTKEATCDNLSTQDGKVEGLAPFNPVVKAKISGEYNGNDRICLWKLDGKDLGTSKPENGYCIRQGLTFYNTGDYKVGLTISNSKKCSKDIQLKVTDLTEEQKKIELETKRVGETTEDVKQTE